MNRWMWLIVMCAISFVCYHEWERRHRVYDIPYHPQPAPTYDELLDEHITNEADY